jgi:hypothetical protein
MKWPWKVEKKPATPAEEKLQQIKDVLFPPLEKHTDHRGDVMYVDYTCDMNLSSAITDLADGYNDEATRDTLVDILKRIEKVRSILKVLSEFDPNAKYIIVDTYKNQEDQAEKIIPRE